LAVSRTKVLTFSGNYFPHAAAPNKYRPLINAYPPISTGFEDVRFVSAQKSSAGEVNAPARCLSLPPTIADPPVRCRKM
jgi:hypothetical protein